MTKIDAKVRAALDASGLPWSTAQGHGHVKLYVAGRLIGVCRPSEKRSSRRETLNLLAAVKRTKREIETQQNSNGKH